MCYTNEEMGLIDGVIRSYFSHGSVSGHIRKRYWETYQHMERDQIGHADLVNIKEALSFVFPSFDGSRQLQKDILSAILKTDALLREVC